VQIVRIHQHLQRFRQVISRVVPDVAAMEEIYLVAQWRATRVIRRSSISDELYFLSPMTGWPIAES